MKNSKNCVRPPYEISEIAEKVFMIKEFGESICYLVIGRDKALLIDTGNGFSDLLSEIRKLTSLPLEVIATHCHTDHVGGKSQFEKIYIHRDDLNWFNRLVCRRITRKIFLFNFNKLNKTNYRGIIDGGHKTEIIPVYGGEVFDLGGRTVEVIHTPGHSLGSVTLLLKEDKLMFTGDNVCPALWMFLPKTASVEKWLEGAKLTLELSKTYTPYMAHFQGLLTKDTIALLVKYGEEILSKQRKNNLFYRYACYPKFDLNGCIMYNKRNVYSEK
jgi:glyoxylase-like metal-dependent hydrolase (beta-lactamase superfamily II)